MKLILFYLLFFCFPIFANSIFYGWQIKSNIPTLYLKGKVVFQANENLIELPTNFTKEEMINYALLVGEFYISKYEKENILQLIQLLKKEKENYEFLQMLLSVFWKLEREEFSQAETELKSYLKQETNSFTKELAQKIFSYIQRKNVKIDNVTYEDLKNFQCKESNNYYSICRVIKLRMYFDYIYREKVDVTREYSNLDRLLAPFFEEEELAHLPFLDRLIPDLPAKLAFLGFATEAIHFQKMLITLEKITGKFDVISYEKLAFYQMVSGNFSEAEESFIFALKNLKASSVVRNSILLKLGMLYYIKKDYKQALDSLAQLNFKYWGRTLKHPILDEPIFINGARDLIALVIWKAKSPALAVKALGELKTNKPNEEELFFRLRIAHILLQDKPAIAEKMTEDIIYIAQSKGWKRVEYAATLLNGYANLINKKYRKSVIQFTKSYGILGSSDPSFTNEWMRQVGMILARIYGKERGNHSATLMKLIQAMRDSALNDNLLTVRLYLDSRYGSEEFLQKSINYFLSEKKYDYLVTSLFYYYIWNQKPELATYQGSLQVSEVNRRIHLYKGFRASLDNVYYKSFLSNFRESYSKELSKQNDAFDLNLIQKASLPVLMIFPFKDQYFAIAYFPESKKWNVQVFNSTEYQSITYYNRLLTNFPFLTKDSSYQIFFNLPGLDLYKYLSRQKISSFGYFFFGFNKDSFLSNSEPVGVECSKEKKLSSVTYYPVEYFEGSKMFEISNRLYIWSFYEISNRTTGNSMDSYEWKCSTGESLTFSRLRRRTNFKTVPTAILFSNPLLHNTSPYFPSFEFYSWIDFWMRKGVSQIVYLDRIDNDITTQTAIRLLGSSSSIPEEWIRLQALWKTNEKEGIVIWRELK